MKKSGEQIRQVINNLSLEISERYPNLYHSISEFYVRQILEAQYEASENDPNQQRRIGVSKRANGQRNVSKPERSPDNNLTSHGNPPGKNKIS